MNEEVSKPNNFPQKNLKQKRKKASKIDRPQKKTIL